MKTCPTCGFENEPASPDCLKCGVIFAKVERARSTEQESFQNEAIINRKIEKVMRQDIPEDEAFCFREKESICDRESYPFIEFLSTLFLFLAALVGIAYIVGAIHFWDFLTQLSFFKTRDKIFLLISITLADVISVGPLLAISGALTLCTSWGQASKIASLRRKSSDGAGDGRRWGRSCFFALKKKREAPTFAIVST